MKKQLTAGILCLLLAVSRAGAAELPELRVEGEAVAGVSHVENGATYVALRSVVGALEPEAEVTWETGSAVVRGRDLELRATPGEDWIEVNGRYLYVPGGVRLQDGRTLVPVRTLADAMGAEVCWDPGTGQILLSAGAEVPRAAYDEQALYWLSRIISAESRGESLRGQIAVGNVVLNRVESGSFPDDVYGVVFDSRWGGQFEPVKNGTVYQQPAEQSVIAAKLCLEGADVAGESLYFLDPVKAAGGWAILNRPFLMAIGVHHFYA